MQTEKGVNRMENAIFERHELKFLLNPQQRRTLERCMQLRMRPDEHGESTVCNVYYDTPNYRLIRRSLDGGIYKEKIRMRSYGVAYGDDAVFLELKKKYNDVVYKRRISLPLDQAEAFMNGKLLFPQDSQIGREIRSFTEYYGDLTPAMHLSYDRSAWYATDDPDLRLTLDRNIRWHTEDCTLSSLPYGRNILEPGQSLLEVKTATAIPLWLVQVLNNNDIRKTSFSKYGRGYLDMLQAGRHHEIGGVSCA